MLHQIGLNHIFDDGTIFFCLLCKESIVENYPLDRDEAICQHFRSEGHEKSARNLFKVCVPDPKCESRNIRYMDIVNNSEFEVREQGNEPSYVSKKERNFVCHICKEDVSKVCCETDKIKYNLQYHLGSEMHKDNVKNSVWWTYHPNLDSNYISLNTIFMYCSFCKQVLESKENCLLEFAANHIETELKNTNSKLEVRNSNSVSNTVYRNLKPDIVSNPELVKANSIDEQNQTKTNSDSALKTEQQETNTNNVLVKGLAELKSSVYNKVKSNVKFACSEIHFNQTPGEIRSACKSLDYDGIDGSQIKENVVISTYNEEFEVLNDDIPSSILKHSQKHTDLSFFVTESEIKRKANFKCDLCHEQIEILNEDTVLSYSYHLDNFHPDNKRSLVKIENASNDYTNDHKHLEGSDIIAKTVSLLPFDLRDHLNFVGLKGQNLHCTLCNCVLSLPNDINTACDLLQNHFSEMYHKNVYDVSVQKNVHHVEDNGKFEENNQLFKGLQLLNRSTINKARSASTLVKNITSEQCNIIVDVPQGKVRSRFEVQKILSKLVDSSSLVDENKFIIDEKEGNFHCQLCDEMLRCSWSGSELIKHLKGEGHLIKSRKGEDNVDKSEKRFNGKIRTPAKVLKILNELSRHNKVIIQNLQDIGEKDGHFFCKRCNEVIMCTLRGKQLVDHLTGLYHGLQMEKLSEEERKLRRRSRPSQQVFNIIWQLTTTVKIVKENTEVLGEKQGHFYCKACDVILLCTCTGKKLIEHLSDQKHVLKKLCLR